MQVLFPGGAGSIGSRTCVAVLAAGHDITVVDILNSSEMALQRVQKTRAES